VCLAIAVRVVAAVLECGHGGDLCRQAHGPRRRDGAQSLQEVRGGAEIGAADAAERVHLRHRFADHDIGTAGGELFERFVRAGVVDVGLVDPDERAGRHPPQERFQFCARDVASRGTVRVDQHDEVVSVARLELQLPEVDVVLIGARKHEPVDAAADDLLQDVRVLSVRRLGQ